MGAIRVSSDGLHSLVGLFGEQSTRVTAGAHAPTVSDGFAASAAAVRAVHHGVDAAAATIGHRLTDTGALVGAARMGYERTDVANATSIGAVASSLDFFGED